MKNGRMIVLNGKGHEVVEADVKKREAIKLFEEGYRFWENVGTEEAPALGERIEPRNIQPKHAIVAMRQISGG